MTLKSRINRNHLSKLAFVAAFTSLIVSSRIIMVNLPNIKLVSFEEKSNEFKEKQIEKDVTKYKYKKQISHIKNEKIKNSLIELSKVYKKK